MTYKNKFQHECIREAEDEFLNGIIHQTKKKNKTNYRTLNYK